MGEGRKILIVEDEILIAQDLQMLLEKEGYNVAGIANNGIEALRLANRHVPAVIFMDINLKGRWDGIQTVEAIRNYYKANIIYLTSSQDPVTLARAEETKPFRILSKFSRHEILETLNQLCPSIGLQ